MFEYKFSDVAISAKARDCWWTVLVVDPIAIRIVWFLANCTRVSPLSVTIVSLFLYLIAATFFALSGYTVAARPWGLYIAAASYLFAFVLDCVDGKLARLTGRTTKAGGYIDRIGGFCGETIVLAGYTYASLTYWSPIYTIIASSIYWAGIVVEFLTWVHSLAGLRQETNDGWQVKNGILGNIDNWLRKHRLGSHPSAVEGGVLAFGVSPFFHMHPAFIGVGALLVWIDQFRFLAKRYVRVGARQKLQTRESL